MMLTWTIPLHSPRMYEHVPCLPLSSVGRSVHLARRLHHRQGMTSLSKLIPAPRLLETNYVDIAAPAVLVWASVRHADLACTALIRGLFYVRSLPERFAGRPVAATAIYLDDLKSTPEQPGFQILASDAPHVLTVGAIGKVWRAKIPFVHVPDAAAYESFKEPGFIKVAWSLSVEPHGAGSRLSLELRVDATDQESWIKFRRYFWFIGPGSRYIRRSGLSTIARALSASDGRQKKHAPPRDDVGDVLAGLGGILRMCAALMSPFSRSKRAHWGLEGASAARALPGDELVSAPRWSWTHAVEIEAAAHTVWPWVAQIGATRAGFYSYQWLENLVGCEVTNAEAVHPEWAVETGDAFSLHPKGPALKVVEHEAGRYFVAFGSLDEHTHEHARESGGHWMAASWLFLVEPIADRRCRFVSRFRTAYSDDLATRLSFGQTLLEPIGFTMDRRMLLGVKARCERQPSINPASVRHANGAALEATGA